MCVTVMKTGKMKSVGNVDSAFVFRGYTNWKDASGEKGALNNHQRSTVHKSGVAVIIGVQTKKLFFLGVRNKYCSTCSIAKMSGNEIPAHVCFQNWNGSSPAMETDIVMEGFSQAEITHGVRYMHLVGDGDSSVLTSIHQRVPVWSIFVRKIECVNHAIKNYRGKLEAVVKGHISREQVNSLNRPYDASLQVPELPSECTHQQETFASCGMICEIVHTMCLVSTPTVTLHSAR